MLGPRSPCWGSTEGCGGRPRTLLSVVVLAATVSARPISCYDCTALHLGALLQLGPTTLRDNNNAAPSLPSRHRLPAPIRYRRPGVRTASAAHTGQLATFEDLCTSSREEARRWVFCHVQDCQPKLSFPSHRRCPCRCRCIPSPAKKERSRATARAYLGFEPSPGPKPPWCLPPGLACNGLHESPLAPIWPSAVLVCQPPTNGRAPVSAKSHDGKVQQRRKVVKSTAPAPGVVMSWVVAVAALLLRSDSLPTSSAPTPQTSPSIIITSAEPTSRSIYLFLVSSLSAVILSHLIQSLTCLSLYSSHCLFPSRELGDRLAPVLSALQSSLAHPDHLNLNSPCTPTQLSPSRSSPACPQLRSAPIPRLTPTALT